MSSPERPGDKPARPGPMEACPTGAGKCAALEACARISEGSTGKDDGTEMQESARPWRRTHASPARCPAYGFGHDNGRPPGDSVLTLVAAQGFKEQHWEKLRAHGVAFVQGLLDAPA